MTEVLGTEELMNVEKAVEKVALAVIELAKDKFAIGSVVTHLQALSGDADVLNAIKGFKNFVPEIKDLSLSEGITLGVSVLMDIPKYLAAMKK